MKFSANLGFLWNELSLPKAISAAFNAGFDAVECHWPYSTPEHEVAQALAETGFSMLGINTLRGNVEAGDNGLSAIPGREAEARAAIDQAVDYAAAIHALNIHVMAGFARGQAAHATFAANLRYACEKAGPHGITILIEPLNHYDAPGYFLQTTNQAKNIIEEIGADNLKLMFDCYHVQIMEGDITRRLKSLMDIVGHIQIASVPARAEPDSGELDYRFVLSELGYCGYTAPVGAEYKPASTTQQGLGWMKKLRDLP